MLLQPYSIHMLPASPHLASQELTTFQQPLAPRRSSQPTMTTEWLIGGLPSAGLKCSAKTPPLYSSNFFVVSTPATSGPCSSNACLICAGFGTPPSAATTPQAMAR